MKADTENILQQEIIEPLNILHDILTKAPYNFKWVKDKYKLPTNSYRVLATRKIINEDNILFPYFIGNSFFRLKITKWGDVSINYPFVNYDPLSINRDFRIFFTTQEIVLYRPGTDINNITKITDALKIHFNVYNLATTQIHLDKYERGYYILKGIRPYWTSVHIWTNDYEEQFNILKRKHEIKKRMETDPDSVTLGDISSIL